MWSGEDEKEIKVWITIGVILLILTAPIGILFGLIFFIYGKIVKGAPESPKEIDVVFPTKQSIKNKKIFFSQSDKDRYNGR